MYRCLNVLKMQDGVNIALEISYCSEIPETWNVESISIFLAFRLFYT